MKLAIFDLDDTLIDFASTRAAANEALTELLVGEGIDAHAYMKAHARVDRHLFGRFERGEISRSEYRLRRFGDPFAEIGEPAAASLVPRLNDLFMACVNDAPVLYEDALDVLDALRRRGVHTAILTNGPSDGQRRKLRSTRLGDHVDHVAIGEEVGFSKPMAQAFLAVVERFGVGAGDALMIGDSPELDYDGARAAGLAAALLDRRQGGQQDGRRRISSLHAVLLHEGEWSGGDAGRRRRQVGTGPG